VHEIDLISILGQILITWYGTICCSSYCTSYLLLFQILLTIKHMLCVVPMCMQLPWL